MYFSNFLARTVLTALVACLVTACGGGGGGSTPPALTNILPVTIDAGPNGNSANSLFATVTVCQPGSSTNCQTIDHVLVDTGSTGLRLLSSVVAPLGLSPQTGASGWPVLNCVQFVDGSFIWGPVATADVMLGSKTASSVPIQVIGDPTYNHLSGACQTGTAMNTVATLGANGILGIGLSLQDCGSSCASSGNGFYFTCSTASCSASVSTAVSTAKQLQNPVSMFASDNNGLLIDLPAVISSAATLSGSIIFGVATETNNQLTNETILKTDTAGSITTVFSGPPMLNSFIDSGSNGLYFNSSAIPSCTNPSASGFYCPTSPPQLPWQLTATISAPPTSPPASVTVPFSVDNAATLFSNSTWAVFPTLAGPSGDPTSSSFDWGLPFFFGKRVFIGFEGHTGSGAYFAF